MDARTNGGSPSRTGAFLARFNRLPESARFYSVLSVLVLILAVASGLTVRSVAATSTVELNSRTPLFKHISPWGHVLGTERNEFLRPTSAALGVLTPIPEEAASYDYLAGAGEGLASIATAHGIDLDLLASANSVSYAALPRRESDVRLPLLYERDRTWDRSTEFLYSIARTIPLGGNGKASRGAPTITRHAVSRGECLWNIAKKYHVRMETIVATNDLPSARYLRPGQILEIPDTDGTYVAIGKGQTISSICKKYDVEVTDLVNFNPGVDIEHLTIGQRLFVPGTKALSDIFRFSWPVHGRISSRYGNRYHPVFHRRMMHTGIDIAAGHGTPIRAALGGRITFAGWKGGYGNTVVVRHDNGYETLYGHCSKILVKRGQIVKKGQQIAKVGSTGISTGPHVHFEVKKSGKRMNPERVLY